MSWCQPMNPLVDMGVELGCQAEEVGWPRGLLKLLKGTGWPKVFSTQSNRLAGFKITQEKNVNTGRFNLCEFNHQCLKTTVFVKCSFVGQL